MMPLTCFSGYVPPTFGLFGHYLMKECAHDEAFGTPGT